MTVKPFWLAADFQALNLPGTNQTWSGLANAAKDATSSFFQPVRDNANKARTVNNRLKSWYTEQVADRTEPIQTLADAAAGFIEDTWQTGVYAYLPMPDYGGYPYLRNAISRALSAEGDADRPQFGDAAWSGGVFLMLAGGRVQILTAMATIAMLFGGRGQTVTDSLGAIFNSSPPLQELAQEFVQLASIPEELWTKEQQDLMNWWDTSIFKDLSEGDWLSQLFAPPGGTTPPVTPPIDPFAGMDDLGTEQVFDDWKALQVGDAINALIPGATNVARQAVNILDNAGAIIGDAGNAITRGLDSVGDLVTGTLDAAAGFTDQIDDAVGGFLYELGQLTVATLVVPPMQGGSHQLKFALSQGFSENALAAPILDTDMVVGGILLVAGATSADQVKASISQVGNVFGIPALAAVAL